MIDLGILIDWLGVKGAIAGLSKSDLTITEIFELTASDKPNGFSKMKREDIAEWAVQKKRDQSRKTTDELMKMDFDALNDYLHNIKASGEEIISILDQLDIPLSSIAKKNLIEFAAREISAMGMYQRVAKGEKGLLVSERKG